MKPYINENTVQFDAISLMRVPLLAGVVLIHCNMLNDEGVNAAAVQTFAEFIWWFGTLFLSPCVPIFFIISGFLFFRGATKLDGAFYRAKMRSRWRSLLVPYLIWNLIGLCLYVYKGSPYSVVFSEECSVYWPAHQSFVSWLTHVAAGFYEKVTAPYPYDFPLWFLRDLIIFVIVSPVIGYALRRLGRWSLAVIIVCCLPMYQITGLIQFLMLIYFFLGAWCSYYVSLNIARTAVVASAVIATICIALMYSIEMLSVVDNVEIITIAVEVLKNISTTVLFYCLAKRVVSRGVTVSSGARSAAFFVYAFHGFLCTPVRQMLIRFFSIDTDAGCFEIYVSAFFILSGVSLTAYWAMKKISPRITSVMCGGR